MRDSRRNLLLESSLPLPLHDSSTSSVSVLRVNTDNDARKIFTRRVVVRPCSKQLGTKGREEKKERERKRERKRGYRRNCADITSAPKNFPRNYSLRSFSIRSRGWKQTVPPRVKERERFLKAERKETWKGGFSTLLVSCYNLPESMQRSLFSPLSSPRKDGLDHSMQPLV